MIKEDVSNTVYLKRKQRDVLLTLNDCTHSVGAGENFVCSLIPWVMSRKVMSRKVGRD